MNCRFYNVSSAEIFAREICLILTPDPEASELALFS